LSLILDRIYLCSHAVMFYCLGLEMKAINFDILSNLSIRRKIWFGFGGLLALLSTVGVITYVSLSSNERKVVHLVEEVQPTVVLSMKLVDQMDRASASLGFYLLSKEEIHKNDYINSLTDISQSATELQQRMVVKDSVKASRLINEVKEKIIKLSAYKTQMLEYAVNDAANVPAIEFASVEVNPRVQNMMQWLQEILLYEEDEPATDKRKLFAIEIANLRHKLLSAVNELRLYMAFRQKTQIDNYKSYRDLIEADVKRLDKYDEEFLTFEQYDAVEKFKQTYAEYFVAGENLIKIHQGDDWRKDAYIIRTELAPLTLSIQERLTELVEILFKNSLDESKALANQVVQTQIIVIGLIFIGFISAVLVGLFLTREIISPIDILKGSAAELAGGNLDKDIDVSRKDELGALAISFSNMRDSIRKKIDDLRILNNTGNDLALLNSRISALKTALRVMGEQTNVSWGSVYLLNPESGELEIQAYYPERDVDEHDAKSFRIGEGILGKAAQQKKVIYIPDTSLEPDFVNSESESEEEKAIICVPMLDGDEIYGVMNFSGSVAEVKFEESDAEFSETISRMTVVASKNIQMVTVIEDQNRNLEKKVEERTSALKKKTNDINNMLQNMHQGIFTIDKSQTVHPEYSAYLENILSTDHIAGVNVMEMLFDDSDLGSNACDQVKAALSAILDEDLMMYDFNKHCLILEYVKNTTSGESKILELDWDPIVFDDDIIDKIMVTVRDVTDIRGLQAEAEQQKWELEIIGQILAISRQKFESFIKTSFDFIEQNENAINDNSEMDQEVIALLFRNMHTIKGNARTYGFEHITDTVHDVETTYDKMRKSEITEWNKKELISAINDVKRLISTHERIYKDKLANNDEDGVFIDNELLERANETLNAVNFNNKKSLSDGVHTIKTLVRAIGTETLESVLEGVVSGMPEMAERLGKINPELFIEQNGIRFTQETAPIMKNVMMHCFRNAIDHGIETAEERIAAGKPERGTITLMSHSVESLLIFRLYDDGRGLDLDKIHQKAIEQGLLKKSQKVTDDQIANYILHSGLSTADQVTKISGRGVGMDAVSKFLIQAGGSLRLILTGKKQGTRNCRQFELVIALPANVYVKVA